MTVPAPPAMKSLPAVLLAALTLSLAACGPSASSTNAATPAHSTPGTVPMHTFEIVKRWPHDPDAFTQGLIFHNGGFLESTGLHGKSSLRRVDLTTGAVLQQIAIPPQHFGEGIAVVGNRIFQLTWKDQKGFVYDLDTFRLEREFHYQGEGWGLATDGQQLILSDGTSAIRFLDPVSAAVQRTIQVSMQGRPVGRLNELEYIKGEIWSNIWGTDYVARIDPKTGNVNSLIDFTNLLTSRERTSQEQVLNGIAYDAATDRLFVTGKWWPTIFEVRLKLK